MPAVRLDVEMNPEPNEATALDAANAPGAHCRQWPRASEFLRYASRGCAETETVTQT
jgi:hypothetical protein